MRVKAAASRPLSVVGHGRSRDAQDAVRGVDDVQAQRRGDVLANGALRGARVELHFAAQKTVRAEPAENEVGVGYRGSTAAQRVAGRTGVRARALGTDPECAARVHVGDAAAARADLEDVHHRDLHRKRLRVAADERGSRRKRFAPVDDSGLRRGASHVEGDGVGETERAAKRLRADDARGRARFEHADALGPRLVRFVESAGRLHQQERSLESGLFQALVDPAHILADDRTDVGVRDHGRAALELAVFAGKLVRGGDEGARQALVHDLPRARLVRGVDVGVKEHDRDRLDARRFEPVAGGVHARFIERHVYPPFGSDALAHLEAQRALDERHVFPEIEVVRVGPVDAPDLVDVAEALGGE